MNERVRTIVEEARKLTPEERMELVDRIELTLANDGEIRTPEEIDAAWMTEVKRRIARAERGEATFVDLDDAVAKARALLKRS